MWRYPKGIYQQWPPRKPVEFEGYMYKFEGLTTEQQDSIGYNKAIPIARDSLKTYVTHWDKVGLEYHEIIDSVVNNEEAIRAKRIAEIDAELAELDKFLPRSVEDLIESGTVQKESLSQYNQDRLERKVELRSELSILYTES